VWRDPAREPPLRFTDVVAWALVDAPTGAEARPVDADGPAPSRPGYLGTLGPGEDEGRIVYR
jgi:hypothetical protein